MQSMEKYLIYFEKYKNMTKFINKKIIFKLFMHKRMGLGIRMDGSKPR